MKDNADELLTRLAFSIYENPGVYALLIGSGVSRAAGIPTGWEITLDLVRRIALANSVEDQVNWAEWYLNETGQEPDYSKIVGELGLARDERRSILHSYIEPTDQDREEGQKIPTDAHFAIADLVRDGFIKVIITTNFDRLLENALRERGVEPTVIASTDSLQGAEPLAHTQCFLLKLHGDYKDARILNTEPELSKYPATYRTLLGRIFDEHGLVICGWSGEWDHALRAEILRRKSRRYSMYWASRGNLGDGAKEIVRHQQGQSFTIPDADTFFTSLRERIRTLKSTHRQDPRSAELLVGSTKRYLAKKEYRIQLDELFTSETDRLLGGLNTSGYTNQGRFTAEEFLARISFYEAASESLSQMFATLGRWGEGEDATLFSDIVASVCAYADRETSGLVPWINLRTYPAVLFLASYGLGLVRAQRWNVLHSTLVTGLRRRLHDDDQRIVDRLFLWSWPGGDNQIWQNLPGFEKRKTALSDHLVEHLRQVARTGVGIVPDFEELYETWEVLASLVHLERHSVENLESVINNTDQSSFELST